MDLDNNRKSKVLNLDNVSSSNKPKPLSFEEFQAAVLKELMEKKKNALNETPAKEETKKDDKQLDDSLKSSQEVEEKVLKEEEKPKEVSEELKEEKIEKVPPNLEDSSNNLEPLPINSPNVPIENNKDHDTIHGASHNKTIFKVKQEINSNITDDVSDDTSKSEPIINIPKKNPNIKMFRDEENFEDKKEISTPLGEIPSLYQMTPFKDEKALESNIKNKKFVSLYQDINSEQEENDNLNEASNSSSKPVSNELPPSSSNSLISNPFLKSDDYNSEVGKIKEKSIPEEKDEIENYKIPEKTLKKRKNTFIFLATIIGVGLVLGIIIILAINQKPYENVAKIYCQAFEKKNQRELDNYLLQFEKNNNIFPIDQERLNQSKISCSLVGHVEPYNDADLSELIRFYNKKYKTNFSFEEAYDVDIKYSVSYQSDNYDTKMPLRIAKINGGWFILDPNN